MSRDLTGYGATPPAAGWPGGARIAVDFVVNYEEGAENSLLNALPAADASQQRLASRRQPDAARQPDEQLVAWTSGRHV